MSYQRLDDSSSSLLAHGAAEKNAAFQPTYSPYQHYRDASLSPPMIYSPSFNNDNTGDLAKVQRLQRISVTTGTVFSLFSKALATALTAIMAYVLYKFYTTKDITAPGRKSPWANGTQLWPAFMLAISSVLTLIIEIGESVASCCTSRYHHAEKIESTFKTTGRVIWVLKWTAVAILYRIGKTTKDLWGWSCDERADRIQHLYPQLNFHDLCLVQTTSWFLGISMAGVKIVLMIVSIGLILRAKRAHRAGGWKVVPRS